MADASSPDGGVTDGGPGADAGPGGIRHVLIIVKEAHSFDAYFGRFPDAGGAIVGQLSDGGPVVLGPLTDGQPNLDESWRATLVAMNSGAMNGFDLVPGATLPDGGFCVWGPCNYVQGSATQIPNYWAIAQDYVLGDNFFSSVHGPTYPNHLYLVGAQSGGYIDGGLNGQGPGGPFGYGWGAADEPVVVVDAGNPPTAPIGWYPGLSGYEPASVPHTSGAGGCDSQLGARVLANTDDAGRLTSVYPCFDFQTLGDVLEDAGLSWKVYYPAAAGFGPAYRRYEPFDSIRHIREAPVFTTNVVDEATHLFADFDAGTLPTVAWVVPEALVSEHPTICAGENWTVNILNALGASQSWSSTAVIITWASYGGFYDHVPPPQLDSYGLGPRVPLLIVSPYAKQGYVDHDLGEFASVLKFVEDLYGLPRLTHRDANPAITNLMGDFDLTQAPRSWTPLALRHNAGSCP